MSKVSRLLKGVSGPRSRKAPGPSPQEAIHRLRETEEMLSRKQEYLEQKIEQELAIARKNGTKNKRGLLCTYCLHHVTLTPPDLATRVK